MFSFPNKEVQLVLFNIDSYVNAHFFFVSCHKHCYLLNSSSKPIRLFEIKSGRGSVPAC